MKLWIEILHAPFEDGTSRHPLVSILLKDELLELAQDVIRPTCECESDDVFDYWEIRPYGLGEDEKKAWITLMEKLGIQGSIWVEYWIKGIS